MLITRVISILFILITQNREGKEEIKIQSKIREKKTNGAECPLKTDEHSENVHIGKRW